MTAAATPHKEDPTNFTRFSASPYDDLTASQTGDLLRLGLHGPLHAADHLIERLDSPAADRWIAGIIRRPPFDQLADPVASLTQHDAPLADIIILKTRGKEIVKGSPGVLETYEAGLAAYYFGLAAALAHHHTLLTRTPVPEIHALMIELAAVSPKPWSDLFTEAAIALQSSLLSIRG
ncbi:MAG: hypothetical protein KF859_05945 [Phycisphaeraceae bacterium]|nr:hypothetical protein [Phycisphaeraceae bacterium]